MKAPKSRRTGGPRRGIEPCDEARPSPDDEAFWRRQEKRRFGSLAQPCCTLSGMCHLLGRLQDDLAVVIHGDQDCGNSFIHHWMPRADNFFLTRLSEAQTLKGDADAPLAELLRLVLAERNPEAVFVLTTCLIGMIGSDPGPTVARIARAASVPVVLLRTGGLQVGTQAAMADWLYSELAALPPLPAPARRRGKGRQCNLIGLPAAGIDESELHEVLDECGIALNGLFPSTVHLADWRRIARADADVVVDRGLYPRLLGKLEAMGRAPAVEVPLPIGIGQTVRFYWALGERFGVRDRMRRALQPRIEPLARLQKEFVVRSRGRRVAFGLRMHNDFRPDMLAYGGLGEAMALRELGFDVTVVIQGPVEEQERFKALLAEQRCPLPHMVVPHPWHLAPFLEKGRFDLVIMPEHCLEEARKAGLPLVASRELAPMLSGVRGNLALLAELLAPTGSDGGRTP